MTITLALQRNPSGTEHHYRAFDGERYIAASIALTLTAGFGAWLST